MGAGSSARDRRSPVGELQGLGERVRLDLPDAASFELSGRVKPRKQTRGEGVAGTHSIGHHDRDAWGLNSVAMGDAETAVAASRHNDEVGTERQPRRGHRVRGRLGVQPGQVSTADFDDVRQRDPAFEAREVTCAIASEARPDVRVEGQDSAPVLAAHDRLERRRTGLANEGDRSKVERRDLVGEGGRRTIQTEQTVGGALAVERVRGLTGLYVDHRKRRRLVARRHEPTVHAICLQAAPQHSPEPVG